MQTPEPHQWVPNGVSLQQTAALAEGFILGPHMAEMVCAGRAWTSLVAVSLQLDTGGRWG